MQTLILIAAISGQVEATEPAPLAAPIRLPGESVEVPSGPKCSGPDCAAPDPAPAQSVLAAPPPVATAPTTFAPLQAVRSLIPHQAAPVAASRAPSGPGTELTRIFAHRGFTSNCGSCRKLAQKMDCEGSRWVMRNRGAITREIVGNAKAQGVMVGPVRRLAIRNAVFRSARRGR